MELLFVLVALFLVCGVAYWIYCNAGSTESSDEVKELEDNLMAESEPFKGKVLEIPDVENSYENVAAFLAAYIRAIIGMEKILGLKRNQGFRVLDDTGAELQDFRYRAFLMGALLFHGKINTADSYGQVAACGSRYFYPDIYIFSCEAVEKDLIQVASGVLLDIGEPEDLPENEDGN